MNMNFKAVMHLIYNVYLHLECRTNNQGVFVKHYAPSGNKVKKAILSFKVKVKVTR